MIDKRCFICKYTDPNNAENVEYHGLLYNNSGAAQKISLCWNHSVKLFKVGQYKFFKPYLPIIMSQYGQRQDEQILEESGILDHKEKDEAA